MAALEILSNVHTRVLASADQRLGLRRRPNTWESAEILRGEGDDTTRLDALAAIVNAFVWLAETDEEWEDAGFSHQPDYEPTYDVETFVAVVNDRLLHARVDWLFEDGRFQERGNYVMHSEVLRPATVLLADDPAFIRASAAFQSALTRLSKGETDVALTEAATSLQEFFRALGVDGNSVSDQLNKAQQVKFISKADRSLMKPLIDWVNADRSERGNAHHHRAGDVSKADAWLMMHVVGALMVRLSNREPRDIIAAREQHEAQAAEREAQEQREREAAEAATVVEPWTRFESDTPF